MCLKSQNLELKPGLFSPRYPEPEPFPRRSLPLVQRFTDFCAERLTKTINILAYFLYKILTRECILIALFLPAREGIYRRDTLCSSLKPQWLAVACLLPCKEQLKTSRMTEDPSNTPDTYCCRTCWDVTLSRGNMGASYVIRH